MRKIVFVICILGIFGGCHNSNKNVIEIGAILPLSGTIASAGIDSQNGLELAIEHMNKSLEQKNTQLKITYEDHKAIAKEAVTAINKLINLNKVKVIYCQLTNTSLAIKPIIESNQILTFSVSGAADLVNKTNNIYRNYINPDYYASMTSNLLRDSLHIKQIGIVTANNEFGQSMASSITKAINNEGINIRFEETYDDQQLDYRSFVTKLLNNYKDINDIYVIGVGKSLGLIIKQIREANFKGRIIGGIELPYDEVINIIGENKNNIYYIDFAFSANNNFKVAEKFITEYKNKYGKSPNTSSAIAYDAIQILTKCILENIDFKNIDLTMQGVTGNIIIKNHEIFYELGLKTL